MNKLILFSILAVGLCFAKENCKFLNIDTSKYQSTTIYNFRCTNIKGYDYVDHEVLVKFKSLDAIYSSYYIDSIKRKEETFDYTTNEKKNEEVEYIGYKCVNLFDEFNIIIKGNCYITSLESMNNTLVNKWNKLKKNIKKKDKTNDYEPDGGWYCDTHDCPPSWKDSDGNCKKGW